MVKPKASRSRLGQTLDDFMHARRMSQSELAEALGVSPTYVGNVRAGRKSLSPEKIDAWCDTLGLEEEIVRKLHRAAALDAGFRLDLPDDW